ncbi:MAG: four helix bundle protein [Prevotella sp.]|nr:four helix bundle protein [Prevotella sp.]
MRIDNDNLIVQKSKSFAIRCVNLYKYLVDNKNEYVMSKQMLRCGTSIGTNVKEAMRGQSKADFGAKMNIALKEANETEYWLEIMQETDYLTKSEAESMLSDCRELLKLLTSIVKTTFTNK